LGKKSSLSLVDKLSLLVLGEMLAVLVFVLDAIPLVLPGVLSESWVIGKTRHEEITAGDRIVDGELGSVSNGIRVWGKFSALEKEGTSEGEGN
jgi:hypothetical protein